MAKWQEISELIYTTLSSYTPLTDLLSKAILNDKGIHALIAPQSEGPKFVTYFAGYEGLFSKDSAIEYSGVINSFAPSYNEAIAIADQVTAAIGASPITFNIISGKPVFTDQDEFYIEQIFNIKK